MGDERQKSGDDVGPIRTGTKCLHFSSILVRFNLGKSNSDDFKRKLFFHLEDCTLIGELCLVEVNQCAEF